MPDCCHFSDFRLLASDLLFPDLIVTTINHIIPEVANKTSQCHNAVPQCHYYLHRASPDGEPEGDILLPGQFSLQHGKHSQFFLVVTLIHAAVCG